MAEHVLSICEKINSRPPRFLGTSLLIGLYLFSLVAAFLGLGAGTFARREQLSEETLLMKRNPPYLISSIDGIQQSRTNLTHTWIIVSTTNKNDGDWIQTMVGKDKGAILLDEQIASSRFLFVSTNAARTMARRLKAEALTHPGAHVACNKDFFKWFEGSWKFEAPSEEDARRVEEDLKASGLLDLSPRLAAPWDAAFSLSVSNRESRRQWIAMTEAESKASRAIYNSARAAWKARGKPTNDMPTFASRAEVAREIPNHLTNFHGTIDTDLLLRFQHYASDTNRDDDVPELKDEVALQRLGATLDASEPVVNTGITIERRGREVAITSIVYAKLPGGFTTIGQWLLKEGCTNIHYSITPFDFAF